ncbi:MAG: 4,5-DOPA dioxygenase extradiol [Deltaproteobacteria bacterium]|nr:4,5-DOPA dioxygenase extradiol [Deltaproteobacteria bacterium]
MPVVFVGHGSPMNALEDNHWSQGFTALAASLPQPKAILSISAHWFVDGTFVTNDVRPRTIYDFSGFPEALYAIAYPAPGSIDLAHRALGLLGTVLGTTHAAPSADWGLDHGTWSVLKWMYPAADVPVVQLSINRRLEIQQHYDLARSLFALRDEGVLILGSGNVVHNLRDAFRNMQTGSTATPDWAARFDARVAEILRQRDTSALLSLWPKTDDARLAHPTPDHWLPLIYAYATTTDQDTLRFPVEGFDLGSLSMRSLAFVPT